MILARGRFEYRRLRSKDSSNSLFSFLSLLLNLDSQNLSYRYFALTNAIASGYGLTTIFLPSKTSLWRLLLVLDLVSTHFSFFF